MILMLGEDESGVMVQSGQVEIVGHVVQGVGSVDVPITGGPDGGVPVVVAKLYTHPALISDCVIV